MDKLRSIFCYCDTSSQEVVLQIDDTGILPNMVDFYTAEITISLTYTLNGTYSQPTDFLLLLPQGMDPAAIHSNQLANYRKYPITQNQGFSQGGLEVSAYL